MVRFFKKTVVQIVSLAIFTISAVSAQTVYDSSTLVDTNNTSTSTSTVNTTNTSTSTSNSTSTSTVNSSSVNTNNNVMSGTVTNNNNNVNSGTMTYNNNNVNSGTQTFNNNNNTTSANTNNNNNVSSSTATNNNVNQNINSGTMNNNNNINQRVQSPPASAIAPAMMSGGNNDLCTTGTSGAVQTQILGVSSGGTVRDLNCERLKNSKTLYDMGMKVAAVAMLCQDRRIFDAMWNAGTPCPYEGQIGQQAKAQWEANPHRIPAIEKPNKDDFYAKTGYAAGIGVLIFKLFGF